MPSFPDPSGDGAREMSVKLGREGRRGIGRKMVEFKMEIGFQDGGEPIPESLNSLEIVTRECLKSVQGGQALRHPGEKSLGGA
jgi:hypothetical protein